MVKGMGHLAVTAKDMDKSLDFYTKVLGFKKVFEINRPETGEPWIIYLHVADRQFVELFYSSGTSDSPDPWKDKVNGFAHICLEVDDIHAIAKHIVDCGCTLDVEPKQGSDGNWQCWTKDPNGIRVELMQLSETGLQAKAIRGEI